MNISKTIAAIGVILAVLTFWINIPVAIPVICIDVAILI